MTFEKLKAIFPDAYLSNEKESSDDLLVFPFYNKWVHVQKKGVSEKEEQLLTLLLDKASQTEAAVFSARSPWHAFFIGETEEAPGKDALVRTIQIELQKKDEEFDQKVWLDSMSNMFDPVIDVFFLTDHLCLVIQNEKGRYLKVEEIEGMIQTLDDDFSTKTYCYIGQYWNPAENYRAVYEEEREIFQREQQRTGKAVLTLPDVALRYYTEEAVTDSPIMQGLKAYISSQPEWKELILALWESRGNVSMAAKSMFIHRNTLQYRIDRFYESTGMSLRDLNDLIVSYMLIV